MPAFFGYLASVMLIVSAFVLGAMKLVQTEPAQMSPPAKAAAKAAPAPAKATLYAARRKPILAPAQKSSHVAAHKAAPPARHAPRPNLPPQFYAGAGEAPAERALGYAGEPASAFLSDRRFR